MRKLYYATAMIDVVFVAEDGILKNEKETLAKHFLKEEFDCSTSMSKLNISEVTSINDVPSEWVDGDPWGQDHDELTVGDWLSKKRSQPVVEDQERKKFLEIKRQYFALKDKFEGFGV